MCWICLCKDSGENAAICFVPKGISRNSTEHDVHVSKWNEMTMQHSCRFVRVILAHVSGFHRFPHSSFANWGVAHFATFCNPLSNAISDLLSDSAYFPVKENWVPPQVVRLWMSSAYSLNLSLCSSSPLFRWKRYSRWNTFLIAFVTLRLSFWLISSCSIQQQANCLLDLACIMPVFSSKSSI